MTRGVAERDMAHPEGREIVRGLAAKSDVFVEAYRPGALEKLELGPEQIKAVNPRIVYTKEGLVFAISTPPGRAPTGRTNVTS